ncbi:hypothetical protein D3C81_755970 [compost metagenome]
MPDHAHTFGMVATETRMHAVVGFQHVDQFLRGQALWVEGAVDVGKRPRHGGNDHGDARQTQRQARRTQGWPGWR